MLREQATINSDTARRRAPASQAGGWHDDSVHLRYYGSSATNGGERIVESRSGRHMRNVCGF